MQRPHSLLCLLALTCGTAAIVAQTQSDTTAAASAPTTGLTISSGLDYSRGGYGLAQDTTVFSVPAEISYESGPWILRLLVPWMSIDGPAAVAGPGAGAIRPVSGYEQGLGDIWLGGTYRSGPVVGGVDLDVTVRAKLPTADDSRGLGTGETDVYSQLELSRSFGGITPFATLGWRELGRNALYPFRDGAYASGGAHLRATDRTVFTAAADWAEPYVAGGDDARSATVAVTHDLTPRWRVMAYALKGFSDASPDTGGGLRINYRF